MLLGRLTALLRALMPSMAGMSGMRYRTFLVWNAAGGVDLGAGLRAARLRVRVRARRRRQDPHLGAAGDPRRSSSRSTWSLHLRKRKRERAEAEAFAQANAEPEVTARVIHDLRRIGVLRP